MNKHQESSTMTATGSSFQKMEANLKNLINKFVEEFLSKFVWESKENYAPLSQFLIKNLTQNDFFGLDPFELNKIVFNLINHFEHVSAKLKVDTNELRRIIYTNVLFDLNGTIEFRNIFTQLLFTNLSEEKIDRDLICKFYLNKRLNYLYSQYQYQLIENKENKSSSKEDATKRITCLKQINYSLVMINDFVKKQPLNEDLPASSHEWIYLLLSSIIYN